MHIHLSRREILARISATAALLALPESQTLAQARSKRLTELSSLAKEHGFTSDGPGLAVFARQSPKIRVAECFGLANTKTKDPITERTTFELASMGKMITATAVLMLHDRGQLSVSDDVRKHLPEVPEYDKTTPVRLLDMLHHVSGLPSYQKIAKLPSTDPKFWVNDDFVREFGRLGLKLPAEFPAQQKYEYNNTNYMLLAVVIERVAKKPFAKFLRDEVFGPAGMKGAFVYNNPGTLPARATRSDAIGYKLEKDTYQASWGLPPDRQETLLTCGDGGIWGSLRDLEALDAMLLKPGLFKPETAKLALAPSRTKDGKVNPYGCGRKLYFDNLSGKLNGYGHEGFWSGFSHSYYYDLIKKRSTVLLCNKDDFPRDKFWYANDKRIDSIA